MGDILLYSLIGIFLGPMLSVLVTPVAVLLSKIFVVPFLREKMLKKAEEEGHILTATLKKKYDALHYDETGPHATNEEVGVYTYEYNGKTYRYRLSSNWSIPDTITLYYIKNPKKATLAGDLGNRETPWLKIYCIVSVIIAVGFVIVASLGAL